MDDIKMLLNQGVLEVADHLRDEALMDFLRCANGIFTLTVGEELIVAKKWLEEHPASLFLPQAVKQLQDSTKL